MAPNKKKPKSSQPEVPLHGQAAATAPNATVAEAGAQEPVTDAPPAEADGRTPPAQEAEVAAENIANIAATSGPAAEADVVRTESLVLSFPLPEGIAPEALHAASVVVSTRRAAGRWRAGRHFTREETSIAYSDLSEQHLAALAGDADLIVKLRVPKPA